MTDSKHWSATNRAYKCSIVKIRHKSEPVSTKLLNYHCDCKAVISSKERRPLVRQIENTGLPLILQRLSA